MMVMMGADFLDVSWVPENWFMENSINSINLIRMFMGQFLKGNNVVLLKIHNGRIMHMHKF